MGILEGKVAIVTAAAGAGIGQATARRFAQEGAHVVVTDAHARRTQEVAEALSREFNREVLGVELNVADSQQVEGMARTVLEKYGKIDILVNNAGINRLVPVWEMDDQTWDMVIGVCLTGTFKCTRAVLPSMIEQKSGNIVSLSSVAGWWTSDEGEAHYCAAKAGIMGFTRAVATEVAQYGVRVNAVAPGVIYNPFLGRIYPEDWFENQRQRTPLGRLGEPQEVANLITFLVSDQAAYITGEVMCVSGGRVMHA